MASVDQVHEAALAALSRRALSAHELRSRLARKGFERGEIDAVVARLERAGLVDDRALAYNFAQRRAEEGRRGPSRVRAELTTRGIAPGLAAEAVAEAFPPDTREAALETAFARLTHGRVPADRSARDRLVRRLVRSGFALGAVFALLERAGADDQDVPYDVDVHGDDDAVE